tara:strand:+ start:1365 stop:3299 length:1935 start_codon:yes stop_codon:yes gene_type:complete
MAREKLFGKDTVAGAKEVKNVAAQISKIMSSIDMSKLSGPMAQVAKESRDMANELANSEKYSKENVKLAKQQSKAAALGVKYATTQNKTVKIFRSFQISRLKGEDEFTQALKDSSKEFDNMKQAAKDLADAAGEIGSELKDGFDGLDTVFGGIGESIGGFVTNPLTIAIAALAAFNAQQEVIAKEFGAIGVTEFREELAGASQEFVQIGLESADALTTIKSLGTEFGISFQAATNLADSVGDLAVSTGLAVEDSTKLLGALTTIGGLSEEAALNFSKSAEQLAVANGIAPNVVLKDIADNTETFAKFSQTGTQGLARAAIQARKLGVELSDVAGAMEGMLDFQSSLNAEVEASVILGRNVNLQKARELSLAGDIEGFQKEILNQIGSQAEFDKMNVLQKKALAEATGMSVEQLSKMVSKEKEAVTLSGAFAKASQNMIPEEAITGTAQILADFQVLGMQLAEQFGPAIMTIVNAFSTVVGVLAKMKVILPAIIGLMVTLKILSISVAIANTFSTAMKTFKDIPVVGIFLGVAAAIGAIATIMSFVGDAVIPSPMSTDRPMVSPAGSPNTLVGRKDDDILMAPGIATAKAATSAATNVVSNTMDTSGLEKILAATNAKLDEVKVGVAGVGKDAGKAAGKAFGGMV